MYDGLSTADKLTCSSSAGQEVADISNPIFRSVKSINIGTYFGATTPKQNVIKNKIKIN